MISVAQGLGDPKAAGLISTFYTNQWNDKAWEQDLLMDITSSERFAGIKEKGDTVTIPLEPTVTINTFTEGQDLEKDRDLPATETITIDQAFYFNKVVGPVTQEMSYVDLLGKYQEVGRKGGLDDVHSKFFAWLSGKGHASNKGNSAGAKSGQLVLGTSDAPVMVSPATILMYLTQFQVVFGEQKWRDGQISLVLPDLLDWIFLHSELKAVNVSGDDRSMLVTGYRGKLGRQKMYVTTYISGAGTQGDPFHIFALMKRGVAYTMRLNRNRLWQYENFDVSAQGLGVWGRGVVDSTCIAEGYCYLDPTCLPTTS